MCAFICGYKQLQKISSNRLTFYIIIIELSRFKDHSVS